MMLRRTFLRFAAVAILTPALDWTFRPERQTWTVDGHWIGEYVESSSADLRTFMFEFSIESTP